MVEIIHEFIIKEEVRSRFELMYGPGGGWSGLFVRAPGFRGLSLLRDMVNRRRYLMVEVWDAEGQRERALAERQAEYAALNATLADWCETRAAMGVFTMLAQASVRPVRGGRPDRS